MPIYLNPPLEVSVPVDERQGPLEHDIGLIGWVLAEVSEEGLVGMREGECRARWRWVTWANGFATGHANCSSVEERERGLLRGGGPSHYLAS